jgi:hypothetical protein
MISNGHGVEDFSRWYCVYGDTSTHKERISPNQICQRNLQLHFHGNWTSVRASMSGSVECEHEHILLIDSLLGYHEHGGDTDGPTIDSNSTAQGL